MKKTVVLIDDDEDDLAEMQQAVLHLDPSIPCIPFLHANEALVYLIQGSAPRADCIFINLNMPHLNGIECLVKLRELTEFSSVCIAVFSTYMPAAISEKLVTLGATYAFQRPLKYKDLMQTLRAIVSGSGKIPTF